MKVLYLSHNYCATCYFKLSLRFTCYSAMKKNIILLSIDYTSDNGTLFAHFYEKNDVEKCRFPQIPKMSVDKSLRMIYNPIYKRTNVPISERR